MVDIIAILVGLLAIVQFFVKTDNWTFAKRLSALIILGALSILIFSFNSNSATVVSAFSDYSAALDNNSANESNYVAPQETAIPSNVQTSSNSTVNTNPPATATSTQKVQENPTVSNDQPYSIYRSDKVLSLKRGKHYPYICDPEIKNCLGFTMKFSYQLSEGHYVKNVWLVCVRENGKDWVQVGEITINEGEEKEFVIRFDRAISFTEIVIQRPIDYNGYINTDTLSIYDVVYK